MPDEFGHLPVYLASAGDVQQPHPGFFQPIPFTEIEAWARMAGLELTSFEAMALHKMSDAHAGMMNRDRSQEPCPISLPEDQQLQSEDDMMAAVATWKAMATTG